ncbi:MAG: 8-oxo-dGTP diphosphatase MutT [Steroidobacteraceae bacterium]
MSDALQVVAGIVRDAEQRVLITQRPPGKYLAGWWEFPGGKLAEGESGQRALQRELAEELGVVVLASRPLLTLHHDYPERSVHLAVYAVEAYEGEPRGLEGQALKWVSCAQLAEEQLLPADRPIVEHLIQSAVSR